MKRRKDPKNRVLKDGEGFRTQKGKLMYYYAFRDENGKRKFIYATDLSKLREREETLERDRLNGMRFSGNATVNDFYDRWVSIKRGLKENTFRNYKYMYQTFVMDTLGKTKLKDLTRSKIKKFYIDLVEQRHLKVRTVESIHIVVYQVLQVAVDDDYLRTNLAANGMTELKKTMSNDEEKRMALTRDQERAFRESLDEQRNSWFKPIFLTMLDTGLRVGEVTGLRWKDIDLENGVIDVNHTLVYFDKGYNPVTKKKCHYAINTPKTKNSERKVPMTKELKRKQEENKFSCTTIVDGYSDFAFFNQMFTVYNQATLNKAIHRIRRDYNLDQMEKLDAGTIKEEDMVLIPHFSCHVLRHTAATRLCESGVNTRFIMDMLGHADIRTTMNIYVDVTKDFQKSELEKFENYQMKA